MPTPLVKKVHTLTGHPDCVYTLQASGDAQHFFSADGKGMVARWDLAQPEEGELIAKLPNSIYALHYLKDTDQLIAAQNYSGIHLLDWKDKKELASLQISNAAIFDIQSIGNDLWVAGGDGSLTIIDLKEWRIKKRTHISEKSIRAMAVNPNGSEVAISFSDFSIRIFSTEDYSLKYEFVAHTNSVFTLSYIPNSNYLISGGRDAKLRLWDTANRYQPVEEIAAHLYAINHLVFSPDGNYFATASMDKSVKVWDTRALKLLKVIDKGRHAGHGTSVNKLLWTPYQNQLISASDDRSISVWEIDFSVISEVNEKK
ncbi:MAG: WD40 repeat domain-containing protein [Cyclobacteriaceae bacterium]|jgi:WD40 repeat protein|nr:WD40 repeat domain-containing protein [Flammeovirgaceae bacterium]